MNNAAPVPTSSEMRNMMKTTDPYCNSPSSATSLTAVRKSTGLTGNILDHKEFKFLIYGPTDSSLDLI
ncbi:hypothetical protein TNCV_4691561 [Trichonephila clavipes]|nr:hypothetical protein TNCV_4691561 [Trichonephila clavipes]